MNENLVTVMEKNFVQHRKTMQDLSITAIVKAYDYINTLRDFIPQENEVLDNIEDILAPLTGVMNELITDNRCPHCGSNLFFSDLPQYDYVCVSCDENF